jgi:rhomboid protease GluP
MNQTEPQNMTPANPSTQQGNDTSAADASGNSVRVRFPDGTAWLTYVLLAVTIGVYLLQVVSQNLLGADYPAYFGMKINESINQGQVWRFLTPVFLHGSLMHIGFNMYALNIFGRGLEKRYGTLRFAILYFMGALAGNTLSFLLSPNPSLGASTAVFGLAAAEGVFIYRNRQFFGKTGRSVLINILTILGVNLLLGLSPGIDNWGHLGGLMGGALFAWFAGPLYEINGTWPHLSMVDRQGSMIIFATFMFEGFFWLLLALAGMLF